MQNFHGLLMQEDYKQAFEDIFFGSDCDPPYSIYLIMADGLRHRLDMRLNRKLNKVFDLSKILRTEVEFNVTADFIKLR